jgi:rod shape-determining protein MreC
MSRERYAYAVTQTSVRPLIQRGLLILLACAGFTLLMLEHSQHPSAQRLRRSMLDMVSPVLEVLARPVSSMKNASTAITDYFGAVDENRRLKIENERLRHWQSAALALKAENDALRQLSHYQEMPAASFITARVVGQSPSAYSQTLMINAGADEGIQSLQPVVDSYGLIGRVTDVGEHTSRVLLLSDANSRVPVITNDTRQHAILAGTGDDLLRLTRITVDQANLTLGEAVVTTAEGNLIPGGLAVGQVFRSDKTGYSVKPVRPLTQTEYVRVITQ